jgi:hypothetical protein
LTTEQFRAKAVESSESVKKSQACARTAEKQEERLARSGKRKAKRAEAENPPDDKSV